MRISNPILNSCDKRHRVGTSRMGLGQTNMMVSTAGIPGSNRKFRLDQV